MCGRFNLIDDPLTRALLDSLAIFNTIDSRYNICPTESIDTIIDREQVPTRIQTRWWLTPSWAPEPTVRYSMFNAKGETLEQSKAFAKPFRTQRCLIPVSGWIEWRADAGKKQPYLISGDRCAFALGGIWDRWGDPRDPLLSSAIITTDAVPELAILHTRMPLIIDPTQFRTWLDPATPLEAIRSLVAPTLPSPITIAPLDPVINNGRIKDQRAHQPVGDPLSD